MTAPSDGRGGAGDRPLPAAVPPDPRERRVVGPGLHRVDERRRAPGRCSPGTTSRSCPARSASTTCASPRRAPRRPSWPRAHGIERVLLLALLVRRAPAARAPVPGGARAAASPTSRSASAGPTRPGRRSGPAATACSSTQTYPGPTTTRRHFDAVLPAFEDPRYLRVDGRPLFFVYRPSDLPGRPCVRRPVARARRARPVSPVSTSWARRRAAGRAAASGFDAELQVPLYEAARRRINGPVGARIERLAAATPPCAVRARFAASAPATSAAPAPPGRAARTGTTRPASAPAASS